MTPKMGGVLKNRYLKRHTLMAHTHTAENVCAQFFLEPL